MKNLLNKYKYALIALIVIIAGFWAYATYGPDQSVRTILETPQEVVGEELFQKLAIIEGIELNDRIFSNPDFQRLQDIETEIPSGIAGRSNPFGPRGSDTGGTLKDPINIYESVTPAEEFFEQETVQEQSTTTPAQ